jgi:hypothetical protein
MILFFFEKKLVVGMFNSLNLKNLNIGKLGLGSNDKVWLNFLA